MARHRGLRWPGRGGRSRSSGARGWPILALGQCLALRGSSLDQQHGEDIRVANACIALYLGMHFDILEEN
jgi:hypothetical protein